MERKISILISKIDKAISLSIIFFVVLIVFLVLLGRNPFSERTLIPNLEPYPDTFHYLLPPLNLIKEGRFVISRNGLEGITPSVPPLYSFVLLPFLLTKQDPRMFYFANFLLSIVSFYLLFLILKKLTKNKWIIGTSLFLFSTNFFMYWYPQWAMAENLILPLFLFAVYLILSETNKRNIIFAGFLSASFFATKYAYLPVTIIFGIIYLTKILFESRNKQHHNLKNALKFVGLALIFVIPALIYANNTIGLNPFSSLISLFKGIFPRFFYAEMTPSASGSAWFSMEHFKNNFPLYINSFLGGNVRFLWDFTPIMPFYVSLIGLIGIIGGFFKKEFTVLSASLFLMLLAQLVFISSFYAVDLRYLYHQIPTLLIGFCMFFALIYNIFKSKKFLVGFYIVLFGLALVYLLTNIQRLRSQTVLNLKYAETPWYYISVKELNNYFDEENQEKPVVISPMVPFYIDFYSNGNYDLLPLSKDQEFRKNREKIWGDGDYSDLHALYKSYLETGKELYVSTYGLGNEEYLHNAFNNLSEEFSLTEEKSACHDMCKIFKVDELQSKE